MKKFIFVITLILVCFQSVSAKNVTLGIMLPDTKTFQTILNGIKSQAGKTLKIINLLNNSNKNFDAVLTNEYYIEKALKTGKPVLAIVNCKIFLNAPYLKTSNLKKVYLIDIPIDTKIKVLQKKFKDIKNFSVVISDDRRLKCFKKVNNLKVFKINNIGEVPYIINKALISSDALIAIPDEKVFNYFSTQFIMKKAIMMGKKVITYSEELLNLGAYAAVIPDYFHEGVKIYQDVLNLIHKDNIGKNYYIPKKIKIVKNKNLM